MADISDVENALVTAIAGVLYPAGVPAPPALSPVAGAPCRIMRGWPNGEQLDADLTAGVVNVNVFQVRSAFRPLPTPETNWVVVSAPLPTLTASITTAAQDYLTTDGGAQITTDAGDPLTISLGNGVVFGGVGGAGQVAAIVVGGSGQAATYAYRLTAADTPLTVAAALAAVVPGATALGNVVALPAPGTVVLVADATAMTIVARQEQAVTVMTWCPTPAIRDAVCAAILPVLLQAYRLAMPDGTGATLWRIGDRTDDVPSQANAWRRDMSLMVRYDTTLSQVQPRVTAVSGNITANGALIEQISSVLPPGQVFINAGTSTAIANSGPQ